jgi:voltage-gated potassium channel Kch
MSLITLIGMLTIGVSTYLILYAHPLYERFERWLRVFERSIPHPDEDAGGTVGAMPPEVVLFGLGRYGGEIALGLRERGCRVLGIDFDPQLVQARRSEGENIRYGDAHDPELLPLLPLRQARWVVSTAPEREVNLALISALRAHGFAGRVAVRAHDEFDAVALQSAGADLVLAPFQDAAREVVDVLSAEEAAELPSPPRA